MDSKSTRDWNCEGNAMYSVRSTYRKIIQFSNGVNRQLFEIFLKIKVLPTKYYSPVRVWYHFENGIICISLIYTSLCSTGHASLITVIGGVFMFWHYHNTFFLCYTKLIWSKVHICQFSRCIAMHFQTCFWSGQWRNRIGGAYKKKPMWCFQVEEHQNQEWTLYCFMFYAIFIFCV